MVRVLFAFTTHPSCHSQWQKAATHHPPLPSYALRILIRWHTRTYHLSLRIIKSTKNLRINYHRHVYYRPTSWQLHAWQLPQACSLSANNLQATSSYQLPQACPLWANNLAVTWMASSTVLIIRNFFSTQLVNTSQYKLPCYLHNHYDIHIILHRLPWAMSIRHRHIHTSWPQINSFMFLYLRDKHLNPNDTYMPFAICQKLAGFLFALACSLHDTALLPFTHHPSHPHHSYSQLACLARWPSMPIITRGMALTNAVAHAAAAAAAVGAGKKAAQVQLQAELNTDDEWNKFLLRDGLLGKLFWNVFNHLAGNFYDHIGIYTPVSFTHWNQPKFFLACFWTNSKVFDGFEKNPSTTSIL